MATIILRLFGLFWYFCLFGIVVPLSMVVVSTTLDQEIANLLNWNITWNYPLITIGLAAMLFGLILVFWSSFTLHRAGKAYPWSIGSHAAFNPHQLVTSGPYAIVRHPMTTSYLLFLVGLALIVPSPVMLLWLIPLTAGLFYEYLEYTEEVQLRRWFGQEYETYHHRTPSIIPKLWPQSTPQTETQASPEIQFEDLPDAPPVVKAKPKPKPKATPKNSQQPTANSKPKGRSATKS